MSSTYTTPTRSIVDEAKAFEESYRKARRAGIAFLQYSSNQLIEKLTSLSDVNLVTESRTFRKIQLATNSSISGRFQAWKLPDTDLYVVQNVEGFVRIEDSNPEEGIYLPSEDLFTSPNFDEESDYIKVAEAIAELDERIANRRLRGTGIED